MPASYGGLIGGGLELLVAASSQNKNSIGPGCRAVRTRRVGGRQNESSVGVTGVYERTRCAAACLF